MSYGMTTQLMEDVLPMDEQLNTPTLFDSARETANYGT
jgi:hypothetical protein